MFSLLADAWLPARRADGQIEHVHPANLTHGMANNPIVAIDWPRADFRVATLELLIGLLATVCPPSNEEAWLMWWQAPPTPDMLGAAFAPFTQAFCLDGSGPRFMQDAENLPGPPHLPETLLIEAPGESTRRNNTALLVKAGRVARLSRPAAAIALFTLQTYAPSGGRGNLTSLRGGGPLTTLVLPGAVVRGQKVALWHMLWANVPRGRPPATDELPRVFPWLAPTRTADRFPATTPADAHPLQVFWGMPRRIRLEFAPNPHGFACDLTGACDSTIVTGWRQRRKGVKYVAWDHPLAPAYKDTKGGGWLAVHPQPGGIGYRHWVALALGDAAMTRRPAPCIKTWYERAFADLRGPVVASTRLLAAGYDMDNMKARAFVESEMPLPGRSDPVAQASLAELATGLVTASEEAARALRRAIIAARYGDDTSLDAAPVVAAYEAFWMATHDAFFEQIIAPNATLGAAAPGWRDRLHRTALELFDIAAPLDPTIASFDFSRIARARRDLLGSLSGYGPVGNRLFIALMLPLPEPAKARGATRGKVKENT
jgi:CRISPR system Cascade subunit CasA